MSAYRNDFDNDTEDDGIEFLEDSYDEDWLKYDLDDDEKPYDDVSMTHQPERRQSDSKSFNKSVISNLSKNDGYSQTGKKSHALTSNAVLSEFFSYVKIVLIAIAVAFFSTQFIIVNAQVPTGSMQNTIMVGDRLIGFRLAYTFDPPQRGDIIIFKYPDNEKEKYVKRVIGTPGDVVQITHGQVFVNGEQLYEPYLAEPMNDNEEDEIYIVPSGHYFVMGDNRNNSHDSRRWNNTYVARNKILAKVIFRYYSGSSKNYSFKLYN